MVGTTQDRTEYCVAAFTAIVIVGMLIIVVMAVLDGLRISSTQLSHVPEKQVEELVSVVQPNIDGNYHPLQYSLEDYTYMTEALYFEARSEPMECQEMVAHVIMARMYDWYYPNTVKEVIWANKQFSYTHDGKHERMYDYKAAVMASESAHLVLSGLSVDKGEGSLYYFNPELADPTWRDDYTFVTKCGKHVFYKRKDKRLWS